VGSLKTAPSILRGSLVVDGSSGVEVVPGPGPELPKVLVLLLVDDTLTPTLTVQVPLSPAAAKEIGEKLLDQSVVVVPAMALPTRWNGQ
jgi:hypothetical protein